MGFWEDIYDLRQSGLIPRVWNRAHIRKALSDKYSANSYNIIPSNASLTREGAVIAGDYMIKGVEPWAWRLGIGAFSLIEDPDDDEATKAAERSLARARAKKIIEFSELDDSYAPSTSNLDYWADMRGKPYTYIRPLDGVFE